MSAEQKLEQLQTALEKFFEETAYAEWKKTVSQVYAICNIGEADTKKRGRVPITNKYHLGPKAYEKLWLALVEVKGEQANQASQQVFNNPVPVQPMTMHGPVQPKLKGGLAGKP